MVPSFATNLNKKLHQMPFLDITLPLVNLKHALIQTVTNVTPMDVYNAKPVSVWL